MFANQFYNLTQRSEGADEDIDQTVIRPSKKPKLEEKDELKVTIKGERYCCPGGSYYYTASANIPGGTFTAWGCIPKDSQAVQMYRTEKQYKIELLAVSQVPKLRLFVKYQLPEGESAFGSAFGIIDISVHAPVNYVVENWEIFKGKVKPIISEEGVFIGTYPQDENANMQVAKPSGKNRDMAQKVFNLLKKQCSEATGLGALCIGAQVKIQIPNDCHDRQNCAKRHEIGFIQIIDEGNKHQTYTNSFTQFEVYEPPLPAIDRSSEDLVFYDKRLVMRFTDNDNQQLVVHSDSPSWATDLGAYWLWKYSFDSNNQGEPIEATIKSMSFSPSFRLWLVARNRGLYEDGNDQNNNQHMYESLKFLRQVNWSFNYKIEVDLSKTWDNGRVYPTNDELIMADQFPVEKPSVKELFDPPIEDRRTLKFLENGQPVDI
ncbi:hypothetical protein MC7420_4858 [Coleofasciculus chthonoplastes PCC 7420]|uniref:Uncharacterized protein n=1 Tax=Coleofasciculus chthonoplastes PCC 7420 TaxID=118168 RepID=B4VNJ4_9CYAN|nr:hypothetical protein [Coleofasciculus chthonoplastes]EDX76602.1 hypothetical protein MC7420_4858 [Coleofasciculus chthonoplastes PCC 7420]